MLTKSVLLNVTVKGDDEHTREEDKKSSGEDDASRQHAGVVVPMSTRDE